VAARYPVAAGRGGWSVAGIAGRLASVGHAGARARERESAMAWVRRRDGAIARWCEDATARGANASAGNGARARGRARALVSEDAGGRWVVVGPGGWPEWLPRDADMAEAAC